MIIYYCFYQTLLYVTKHQKKKLKIFIKNLKLQLRYGTTINSGLLNVYNFKNSLNLELRDILKGQMNPIVMNFIFSPEYLSTQIEIYRVLINELNKKQTISEKINSYSFSRDLKKEGNLEEMVPGLLLLIFIKIVNINKLNYIIQGFIFGLIIYCNYFY